ncbi:hypothetical protein FRB98_002305 [Tulasnella sp. 332]|nr:hypothetical protein FRB98_002305 [Tulasnella sp. 332]
MDSYRLGNKRILIVNPNSSSPITESLRKSTSSPDGCSLQYFTGPKSAPPSIDDDETSFQSERACLPTLKDNLSKGDVDAILIACYSDHPLVHSLRAAISNTHIIGILEASITHALLLGRTFGIVTTGAAWEPVLSKGVAEFLGFDWEAWNKDRGRPCRRFVGVASTGLGVNELHEADQAEVAERIGTAARSLVARGADVICLGCAGMSGMEDLVTSATEGRVTVVDGVQAGVELLAGLVRQRKL